MSSFTIRIDLNKIVNISLLLLSWGIFAQEKKQFTLLSPEETGITFENSIVDTREANILIYSNFYGGAGVGIGDFNNDGLQDIFFAGNQVGDKLYKNLGSLKFEEVTSKANIEDNGGWSSGVVIGDINNDGWQDIYVTRELYDDNSELRRNKLYINTTKESGKNEISFKEMSSEYGLNNSERTRHAAFLDYNNDGLLDVFLLNQPPNPGNFSPMFGTDLKQEKYAPRLYENRGKGSFIDVTKKAKLLNPGFANSIAIFDANNDGWQDIYISNDFEAPDTFYLNNANGTFTKVTDDTMRHISYFGMGVDTGDINNDGLLDVMVLDMVAEDNFRIKSNMSGMNPNTFWRIVDQGGHYQYMFNTLQLNMGLNNGVPQYGDIAQMAGVSSTDWSWSNLIGDFDNDGLKDIHVTNGLLRDIRNTDSDKVVSKYVQKMAEEYVKNNPNMGDVDIWDILDLEETLGHIPSVKLVNYAYKNSNGLQFDKVSKQWGLNQKTFSAGSAYGDLDNDGDLDLVISNVNEVAFVYENNGEEIKEQNFLRVFLTDKENNTPMLGAKVEAVQGNLKQYYAFTSVRGMYSTSEHVAHFGFPSGASIESIKITWPNRQISMLTNISSNTSINVDFGITSKINQGYVNTTSKVFGQLTELPVEHNENVFNDFDKQVLLPHKLSQSGPAMAIGDVNNDGRDDVFVGAAVGKQATLLLQKKDGSFEPSDQNELWKLASKYEDVDAIFFDADNDGDQDLYVVSGGNEWEAQSEFYQDRLYLNDGTGKFKESTEELPKLNESGSVVRPFDYDKDGDMDLFIGGRHIPWDYPSPTHSRILNNENGVFTDVTNTIARDLLNIGLVTDAVWTDFNNDGNQDLVLTGEWMPVTFLENTGKRFENITAKMRMDNTSGWWYSIKAADMDNDGDEDLIVGNLGLNYKYKASDETPFEVHYRDFDQNGSKDIVLSYYNFGEQYPLRGRSCSSQQVPLIGKRFKTYDVFASASLVDVYGERNLNAALHYRAKTFSSIYLVNEGGTFKVQALPLEAQISNIDAILIEDFDGDNVKDVLVAGNMFPVEVETTRNDASIGMLLKGEGGNDFKPVPMENSGVYLPYDVNKLGIIRVNGQKNVLVGVNDGPIYLLKY